jgi:4,5-dihydroxyphthalate decarboxylase
MSRLRLTIMTGDYDRIHPLRDGQVRIEGCDVNYLCMSPEEGFYRAFSNQEFDVTELSFSSYIIARSRGVANYIGLPVFLSRMFRHSAIYIRKDSGIARPQDLKGRKVGVPVYAMTASLWVRGMLAEEYGVMPGDIHWLTGGLEQPGRYGKYPLNLPPHIKVEAIPTDRALSDMLQRGEITALVSARAPSCFDPRGGEIVRLFPDYRSVETEYYRKTGLFPIMHGLAIREDLAKAEPWLASSVYKAFLESKRIAMQEMRDVAALKVTLPWVAAEIEESSALMGDDYWKYGFKPNLRELECMTRWSFEQGLAVRQLDPKELFHPGTLEQARV